MPSLIGSGPNQVSVNGALGKMAFQDNAAINVTGGTISDVTLTALTQTSLKFTTSSYPTSRPTLLLDFVKTLVLDPRITFYRPSIATYYGNSGLLCVASSNVPRFSYDPITLQPKGLLIEEYRLNTFTHTESFDSSTWTVFNTVLIQNTPDTVAPDGTYTACKIYESTASSVAHSIFFTAVSTGTAGASTSYSIYVKAAERTFARIFLYDTVNTANTLFADVNLSTGAVTSVSYTGSASAGVATIQQCPNGWWRCTITGITGGSDTSQRGIIYTMPSVGGSTTFTGTVGYGLYVWGAQFERGSVFPTSYIPSTNAFTSRASIGSYYGSDGLLKLAQINEPRYNYTPSNTTLSPKLLTEAAATNYFTYSEKFDNAVWSKVRASIYPNIATTVAPDGTYTACKLYEDTSSTTTHYVTQYYTKAASAIEYTYSVYVKAAERTCLMIQLDTQIGGNVVYCAFDCANGLKSSVTTTGAFTQTSATMTYVKNGWYRCSITLTTDTDTRLYAEHLLNTTLGTYSYTGNGLSGMYIWGAQLETGPVATTYIPTLNTFTSRASSATYYRYDGYIMNATTNTARYNYTPGNTSLAPKMLLEAASTNLITYSEQFDNAAWNNLLLTVTSGATMAPDGTNTADSIVETSSTGTHALYQSITTTVAAVYAMSIYIKPFPNESRYCFLRMDNQSSTTNYVEAVFNLTLGTVAATTNGVNGTLAFATIQPMINGWYRITLSGKPDTSGTVIRAFVGMTNSGTGSASYAGSTTHGFYVWGGQMEAGAVTSSYIPTTSTTVTRSADVYTSPSTSRSADVYTSSVTARSSDVAYMTGTNFTSWYNQTEGTVVIKASVDFDCAASIHFPMYFTLSDGTTTNRIYFLAADISGGDRQYMSVSTPSGTQASVYSTSIELTTGKASLYAGSYKLNDFAVCNQGTVLTTDTSGYVPLNLDRAYIGSRSDESFFLNGHIASITYYPRKVTNSELAALSTP